MKKEDQVTICFVGTAELKAMLEQWAKQDERSTSYILRQIINREAQRLEQVQPVEKKTVNQQSY